MFVDNCRFLVPSDFIVLILVLVIPNKKRGIVTSVRITLDRKFRCLPCIEANRNGIDYQARVQARGRRREIEEHKKDLKFRVAYVVSRKGGGVRDKCLTYHPRVWPVPRAVLLAIMHTFLGNLQMHK